MYTHTHTHTPHTSNLSVRTQGRQILKNLLLLLSYFVSSYSASSSPPSALLLILLFVFSSCFQFQKPRWWCWVNRSMWTARSKKKEERKKEREEKRKINERTNTSSPCRSLWLKESPGSPCPKPPPQKSPRVFQGPYGLACRKIPKSHWSTGLAKTRFNPLVVLPRKCSCKCSRDARKRPRQCTRSGRAACLQNETAPKSLNFKTKNGPKNDPKLPRKNLSLVLLCRSSHRHYSKIFHREFPHKIKYFFTTRICRHGHANEVVGSYFVWSVTSRVLFVNQAKIRKCGSDPWVISSMEDLDPDLSPCTFEEGSSLMSLWLLDLPFDSLHFWSSELLSPCNFATHETEASRNVHNQVNKTP